MGRMRAARRLPQPFVPKGIVPSHHRKRAMHTASYPSPSRSASVHELKRVRSARVPSSIELSIDERDYRDSSVTSTNAAAVRRSRTRGIAVRILGYLVIATLLFLFGRVLMENPSIRRAVLDFVTFGHADWAHRAAEWLGRLSGR